MNLFFPNSDREGSKNMTEDTEQSAERLPGKTRDGMGHPIMLLQLKFSTLLNRAVGGIV